MDFVYERRRLPNGVKLETVTGGARYKGKVWREIAMQIYCENGKEDYRDIGHFPSGAPFIFGAEERISISHTEGCLAVATIDVAPEIDLSVFSPAAALGVDVESADRKKVIDVRERFLSEKELPLVDVDLLEANVIAWTCKEAMLKAGMNPAIDWLHDIIISKLPTTETPGYGYINLAGNRYNFSLLTIREDNYIITVARSD